MLKPLWVHYAEEGQGKPAGTGEEVSKEGLTSATHRLETGASAESVRCIGCHLRCFIHHYFYWIQLFLEAILIQHADCMHTRFSFKNKTHNDSAM